METKRCAYCHKLQRVGSRVCSLCGRSFVQSESEGERSWSSSISLSSLPAASPHHAGHYSGLHPEDQPYQSQIMVTPQRFIQEMQEKKALQQEPKHIVLPSVQNAPVINKRRGISQAPTHRPLPSRGSRRRLASENTSPENRATRGKFGRDVEKEQISRPFVRERPASAGASPAPTEGISATSRGEEFELAELQQTQKIQDVELPLEDSSFSITNNDPPLLEDLPTYMQEALRARPWPSRIMSTVLVSIGFCVLLATSISVLVLLGNHPSHLHAAAPHAPETQTNVPAPPHLQISTNQITFTASAPGIVSSQTITLKNSGSGQAVWRGNSDQLWLTTFPKSGTFTDSENIQVTANRGGMAPGNYTGHLTFSLPGQENTPAVLNVTMSVAPLPAQLSISTTSLSYSTVQSQSPDSQVITIRNTGGQALHWDATTQDTSPWLTLSLYHGVIPAGVGQPLTVSVASQGLAIGTYTGLISFTGDAHAQVQVVLTVLAPGKLVVAPSSLALTTQQPNQTLSLQNSGDLSLDWTVKPSTTDQGNWLSVTPSSGTLAPGQSITVTVHADATSLASATYQGTLTFSVGDQTQQVAISFVVTRTTPTPVSTLTATPASTSTTTSTAATRQRGGQAN